MEEQGATGAADPKILSEVLGPTTGVAGPPGPPGATGQMGVDVDAGLDMLRRLLGRQRQDKKAERAKNAKRRAQKAARKKNRKK